MRTIIDTSSLIRMAQYYYPFDNTKTIDNFLQSEIQNGSIIVLDKVYEEIKYTSQGIVLKSFSCLEDQKYIRSTSGLMPTNKFYNMLDNMFVDRTIKKRKLGNDENAYQNERQNYLQGADCNMIVYAMNENNEIDPIQILTEESSTQNDGKLFKKIPIICQQINIPTINLVDYFKQHNEDLTIEIKAK